MDRADERVFITGEKSKWQINIVFFTEIIKVYSISFTFFFY